MSNIIPVPYGLNVAVLIARENGTAYVHVIAPMYIKKHWIMSHSYATSDFTDYDIIRDSDFIRVMNNHFPR